MSTTTSIIIPTYNRQSDLPRCLQAVVDNTIQPDEVIIVEQGDATATEQVAAQFNLHTRVEYFTEKSAARARNKGVEVSSGDILLFVDDDVVLDADYIKIAKEYFARNNNVKVVVGKDLVLTGIKRGFFAKLRTLVSWFFWRVSYSQTNRVLWSGHNSFGNFGDKEMQTEWAMASALCVHGTVFQEYRFNPNFIRWSFGEDVMFTYQIHQKYPGSVRYVPSLRFWHNQSTGNRLANTSLIKMKIIYRYIFWKQCVHQGKPWRTFAYVWSQVGFVILQLIETPSWTAVKTLGQGYWYLLKERKHIIKVKADYNSFILSK